VVEAELLVDAALAGHAHHHLSPGAGCAGHFHLSLLNVLRSHQDSTDRLPKCKPKKLNGRRAVTINWVNQGNAFLYIKFWIGIYS